MTRSAERHVLQFCHGYDGPFLDCARQYASLFAGTGYRVTTVFLTGVADAEVAAGCASDEVLFMEYSSKAIRGLKLGAISDLRKIADLAISVFASLIVSNPSTSRCLVLRCR